MCHVLDLRRELWRVIGLDKDALDLIPPIKEPVAGLLAEEIADDHLVDAYLCLLYTSPHVDNDRAYREGDTHSAQNINDCVHDGLTLSPFHVTMQGRGGLLPLPFTR